MAFEILIPISLFAAAAVVVWIIVKAGVERSAHRLEAHAKMLDRFGSSAEFVSFLRTPEGKQYLTAVAVGSKRSQREKILGSIKLGVVTVIFSFGLIAVSFLVGYEDPLETPPFVMGFLAMFLGIGFLASAAVSYWLSKAWDLDGPPAPYVEGRS